MDQKDSPEAIREAASAAARALRSIPSEERSNASRVNGAKSQGPKNPNGGRKRKLLSEIECDCGAGVAGIHKSRCPLGRAIRYRLDNNLPME